MLNRASTFDVAVAGFTGPLDVLLNLIEERKLSVNEISLAAVVEEFVAHSRKTDLTRSEAASFLAVASTLILIKSRSLLPALELTGEEERSIGELEARLETLREFRRLVRTWGPGAERRPGRAREGFCGYDFGFLPPEGTTPAILAGVMRRIAESLPQPYALPEKILKSVLSIEEKAREIASRIGDRVAGTLETVVAGKDAMELIVGFLALLELIKQGLLEVRQNDRFGEVELKRL